MIFIILMLMNIEICAAETFGREFGSYYCRDSVIDESGTKSALSM